MELGLELRSNPKCVSRSVVSNSLWSHGLCITCQASHPWDSPGKNTGVGCHFLLQGIFPVKGSTQVAYIVCRFFTIWTQRPCLSYLPHNSHDHTFSKAIDYSLSLPDKDGFYLLEWSRNSTGSQTSLYTVTCTSSEIICSLSGKITHH